MSFVRTYDTATASKSPLRHLLSIFLYPTVIWQNRYMVQNFLRRDLMGRFHGSFLGIYWLLAQPLFLFCVYYFVFGMLYGRSSVEEALHMFSGVIIFFPLTEATGVSCVLITDNGNLVKKVAFPSEVLPVHVALSSLVVFSVGAIVCLVIELSCGVAEPGWLLLAMPLTMLVQMALTMGIGFILCTSHVFIRDTVQLWRIVSMAWMFLSPVFWNVHLLEGKMPAWGISALVHFNPAYSLIEAHRMVLGATGPEYTDFLGLLGLSAAWAFGLLLVGYTLFVSKKHQFTDLV